MDDDPMTVVVAHKGYTYEKEWISAAVDASADTADDYCDWKLWRCTELGCDGRLAVAPVRARRWWWRKRPVYVYRDDYGRRIALRPCEQQHNHPARTRRQPSTAAGNRRKTVQSVSNVLKITEELNSFETKSSNTHVNNNNSIKDDDTTLKVVNFPEDTVTLVSNELKGTDEVSSFETKSSNTYVNNINSINDDDTLKAVDVPKDTVTTITRVSNVLKITDELNSFETKLSNTHVNNNNSIKDDDTLKVVDFLEDTVTSVTQTSKLLKRTDEFNILEVKASNTHVNNNNSIKNDDTLKVVDLKLDLRTLKVIDFPKDTLTQVSNVLKRTDEVNNFETKSSNTYVNNINSSIDDDTLKVVDVPKDTVTQGINKFCIDKTGSQQFDISNDVINNLNSKEKCIGKNIAICGTNVLDDIDNNKDLNSQIKCMVSRNQSKQIQCFICGLFYSISAYNRHIESVEHKNAAVKYFNDRIDLENLRIFPSFKDDVLEFLSDAKKDFEFLVGNLLLKHNAMLINVYLFGLYLDESLNEEKNNIAEAKQFDVGSKGLTRNTNIHQLYENIIDMILLQSNALIKSGWSLDELLFIEIFIVEILSTNEEESLNDHQDNLPKIQLSRCKECDLFVVQRNYQQHCKTISHKINELYLHSKNVQVTQCEDGILSTLVKAPNHNLLHDFFIAIESVMLDLVGNFLRLTCSPHIKISIKMFGHYKENSNKNSNYLGDVKSFIVRDEILSGVTVLPDWFQKVFCLFKSHDQNYLNIVCQKSHYLDRVMFLEIDFVRISKSVFTD